MNLSGLSKHRNSSGNSLGHAAPGGPRAPPATQRGRTDSLGVLIPQQSPISGTALQLDHPLGVLGSKRKADTAAGGRTKRPALINDQGRPDDSTSPRETGKLVILLAQTIWSTLTVLGRNLIEARNIFGIRVDFDYSTSPAGGLDVVTRAHMVEMHKHLLQSSLTVYGLQGYRVDDVPTFEPNETYAPTHVYPPGSEKSIMVSTGKAPSAAPQAHIQQLAAIPSALSERQPAQVRNGPDTTKANKPKNTSVTGVCIPAVHQETSGSFVNLGSGEKVQLTGPSKNHQKKMARQAKTAQQSRDNDDELATAIRTGDMGTVENYLTQMKADKAKASTAATNNGAKTNARGSVPPPATKKPRQSKAMREALAQGAAVRAAQVQAAGAKNAAAKRGGSQSNAASSGNVNANNSSSPTSHATSSSPFQFGAPPVQQQPSPFVDPATQVNQHQQFNPQINLEGWAQQNSGTADDPSTGPAVSNNENQPLPLSLDRLIKIGNATAPNEQGQVIPQIEGQQAQAPANTGNADVHTETPPKNNNDVADTTPQAPAQTDGPGSAPKTAVQTYNGMRVINNEVETNGYGMQPLAAILPPDTDSTLPGVSNDTTTTQGKPIPVPAVLPDAIPSILPQKGPDEELTGIDLLTQKDLDDVFNDVFRPEDHQLMDWAAFMRGHDEQMAADLAADEILLGPLALFNAGLIDADADGNILPPADDANLNLAPTTGSAARDPTLHEAFKTLGNANATLLSPQPTPQWDGSRSPRSAKENAKPAAVAPAKQVHEAKITQPSTTTAAATTTTATASAATAEQTAAAQSQYAAHLQRTAADQAERRARDSARNRYLAVNKDLPSAAERERRARRKWLHERIAVLRFALGRPLAFPEGHAERFGYEELIREMRAWEEELEGYGDKALMNREYVDVRERGWRWEEHWIPEI